MGLMDGLAPFMPILATIVGTLLSIICGFILSGQKNLEKQIKEADDRNTLRIQEVETKLFNHITHPMIHGEAVAKLTEQINTLFQTVKIAHERIDKMKEPHGR